jgi:hypothetical protein
VLSGEAAKRVRGNVPADARFSLTRLEFALLILATLSHKGRGEEQTASIAPYVR